ncbi:hypothetical protein PR202_gb26504 [Eleusine coracana subsp. coracana]|uniref:Uncharacterized protein n=1 Tax=Eleusine coracana subsp. coracana TaxID=191504 RepID=A0AAV5FS29_ELECO|nr:hypothetical protein PR202_gb26504 [Eleusine coracana subsp. coracana]
MCLRFWCCFGPAPGDDYDYCCSSPTNGSVPPHHHAVPAKTTTTPHNYAPAQRNGHYHQGAVVPHHANGHHRAHHHHHQQLPVADEEYRKASNGLRRGHGPAAAIRGVGPGYAAPAAYVYSGPEGAVKQAATNAVVVADAQGRRGGAHHSYHAADHRYPTTAAATYNFHR